MAANASPSSSPSALHVMGRRLAGHSALYALGAALGFLFLLVQFAVLTRLLPKAAFGQLAILILAGGFITIVCNLAFVTGSLITVFQGGDEDELSEQPERFGVDSRGVLGTGLLTIVLAGAVIVGLCAIFAPWLGRHLLGDAGAGAAVVWAAAGGVVSSLWRLLSAIPRFERRPIVFLSIQTANHALAIGVAAALVATGGGLTEAVAGLTLGRTAALLVAMLVARHRFRLNLTRRYAAKILRQGRPYVILSGAFFLSRNADLFVLTRFVDNAEIATYVVAARLGMIPNFAVSATLFAWGPLLRGPLRAALEKQDAIDVARSRLTSYYLLLATWIVLASVLFAEVFVMIAPKGYAPAAAVVPLLTIAAALHGFMMVLYRMSRFDGKLRKLKQIAIFSVFATVGGSYAFIPSQGVTGAAVVSLLVPLAGAGVMLFYSQRRGNPLRFQRRTMVGCFGLAGLCAAAGLAARGLPFRVEIWVDVALVAAYPLLLIATGALPRSHAARLLGALGGFRGARAEKRRLRASLAGLPPADVELLEALIRRRERPADIGEQLGEAEDDVIRRMVLIVRGLAGTQGRSVIEAKLGRYLLSRASRTQRDRAGYILSLSKEVKALDLDRMTAVVDRLARLPAGAWASARAGEAGTRAVPWFTARGDREAPFP